MLLLFLEQAKLLELAGTAVGAVVPSFTHERRLAGGETHG
jgi:hypothetical protein